jgi:hypothetical protein
MDQVIAIRLNPWLVLAVTLVAAVAALSVAYLIASQLGFIHAISMMLQGPARMALVCPGAPVGC